MFRRRSVRTLTVACTAALALSLLAGAVLADKTTNAKDSGAAKAAPAQGRPGEQSSQGTAAPKASGAAPTAAQQKEMMEQMAKLAAPGPAHEHLKACVGTWKATVKMYMGGQPQVSEGTSEMHMTLGDRFLEQSYKGTFMGQPFEGHGFTGYDNQKSVYQSVWIDNSSTMMTVSEGTWDDASKSLISKSTMLGPDGKPGEVRTVMKLVDPNTLLYSTYWPSNGQDQVMMEITYKRQ